MRSTLLDPRGVAGLAVFLLLSAIGFLPLFGGPGYEQSLASGLLVPAAAAIATALRVSVSHDAAPVAGVRSGVACGAAFAGLAFATALLHGVRVGICDFWGGTVSFLLTAGLGAMLGGVWGAVVGEVCRGVRQRKLACAALAIAAPVGGIIVSVARFYSSPMIFAYDPFFGYFSGTLYDTVVDVRPELWTYRAGSVATLAGVALVASASTRSGGRLRFDVRAKRGGLFLASGLAALAVSFGMTIEGPALGHWQTAATIADALGGRAAGKRCDVVYPDALLGEQVSLIVRDCDEQLAADETKLGTRLDGRLTAFVFADANEKRQLTGAAETSIAKPWRHEVYIQYAAYPHPVLGHEIAHVVSGSFAHGPFHVGGGVVPNPGLIEGVAVAASPEDDELTVGQWARAMRDLGTLPPIRTIFSLGFLGASAQKSYTVAGAFVGWVLDRWGAAAVRAWYGGASIETLTGESWDALEGEFRAWLGTLPMPAEAREYARARFERPSVWVRRCPHVVDALDREADKCRDDHRFARADNLYASALSRDPRDYRALFARAKLAVQAGGAVSRGRDALESIASDENAPRTWRDRAEEALADDDLVHDHAVEAAERYRAIAMRTLDEDAARTLEVKALAAPEPTARQAIVDLLLAEPGRVEDSWLGALSIGMWAQGAQAGPEALADYLAGKNLTLHGRYARAVPWLDRVIERGAPTSRIGREVLRQRAIGACVLRDREAIARLKANVESDDSPFAASWGRRDGLLRLLSRCDAE